MRRDPALLFCARRSPAPYLIRVGVTLKPFPDPSVLLDGC